MHCSDCQTHSGAAFGIVAGIENGQFRLLSGTLKIYTKTAKSGRVRDLSFCPDCGTRIHARTPGAPDAFFGLGVGTLRQRDRIVPKRQVWCRSAQGWVFKLEALEKFARQPG